MQNRLNAVKETQASLRSQLKESQSALETERASRLESVGGLSIHRECGLTRLTEQTSGSTGRLVRPKEGVRAVGERAGSVWSVRSCES